MLEFSNFMLVMYQLTFFHHSNCETFLKATKLAPISSPLVYRAVSATETGVFRSLLYSTLKKAFAAFACQHAIVLAGGDIATNSTRLHLHRFYPLSTSLVGPIVVAAVIE